MLKLRTINFPINHEAIKMPVSNWYNKDTWQYSDLGIDGNQADRKITFTFRRIHQTWLKTLAKRYIQFIAINKSVHFVHQVISSLASFSEYLAASLSCKEPESADEMTRQITIGYFVFLINKGNTAVTRQHRILTMAKFFESCQEWGWIALKERLFYSEDVPKRPLKNPRFIPDTVLNQFNAHLNDMDPHIRRLLLVLQASGMRINELITLCQSSPQWSHLSSPNGATLKVQS